MGEVFICGKETNGGLQVLPQYLGKAIIGLGGGTDQLYVIEGKLKIKRQLYLLLFVLNDFSLAFRFLLTEDEGFLGRMNAVMP